MANLTYPGVYIEEVPSGVHSIAGVATSITAFLGRARRGPVDEPVRIQRFGDFERRFGELWEDSTLGYAVQQFFLNGGADAVIVRLANGAATARYALAPASGADDLVLDAADPGAWGDSLAIAVNHETRPLTTTEASAVFNLVVTELDPVTGRPVTTETHRNVSVDRAAARFVGTVLAQESERIRVPEPYPGTFPTVRPAAAAASRTASGSDGNALGHAQYDDPGLEDAKRGIWALAKADLFNLLCIPPYTPDTDVADSTWAAALAYCKARRALLLVDAPAAWTRTTAALAGAAGFALARDENAALFFPRIRAPDARRENRLATFAPCGAVAGVFARTDATRGVWKAPAGIEAQLHGVPDLAVPLTDGETGQLNPLAVNCLRALPAVGRVVWGSRTWEGADALASEWKYVPVRRLALFIEESLYRGTQWVVFEPNDESLWSQIRLNLGAFMHGLFRQGAFQGTTPRDAYFVKCDPETTTQADINAGVVNIVVGFAPLKPAEFVVIKLQQMAGQTMA